MRRGARAGAAWLLQAHSTLFARSFRSSAAPAEDAAAAAAAGGAQTQAQTAAFPAWLKGGSARVDTPLTRALPGAATRNGYAVPREPPPTEVTALPNGVRIVSEASTGPISSFGVYVNSGSIYETSSTCGASALLECLAFKSTRHRDAQRLMKEVELIGANVMANASREQMSYTIDCLGSHAPAAVELLSDAVLNPRLDEHEVEDQKAHLAAVLSSPDVAVTLMTERLVRGAYEGGLGRPLVPLLSDLGHLTRGTLAAFLAERYTAPRVVLAGSGVDHRKLVELAAPMFESLPSGSSGSGSNNSTSSSSISSSTSDAEPPSRYVGGHVLTPGSAPHAHMILAFEYAGGWLDVQGSVVMTVLTYLLGGGSSFSSGGPGKGMHSRLYTRVLNQYHWAQSCAAFSSTFNASGLVGVQASADPAHARNMLDVACRELEALASPPPAEQLARAKRMAVSLIHNALESRSTSAEDIGRQFLTYGRRISGAEYVAMIEAVTPKMVAEFVRALLASKPSLAAYGDGADALDYGALTARYGPGGGGSNAGTTPLGLWGGRAGAAGGRGGGGGGGIFERFLGQSGGAARHNGGGGAAPAAAKSTSASN